MTRLLIFLLALLPAGPVAAASLPALDAGSPGEISLDEEYRLGRAWLRTLRAQAPLAEDPELYLYTDSLLAKIAGYTTLPDRRLALVIINSRALNAFAAPGGVIGINLGLFLHARSESQFASVLAHELAHLSQRHYARGVEEQQNQLPLRLAATLAGILLAVNSDGDAGTAAILSGQTAFADRGLAFSRAHEQEADRIGMQALAQAGYDPRAMPEMFAEMQRSSRFNGNDVPEFLLTHPVTQSRIADALNGASRLAEQGTRDTLQYRLMRARAEVLAARDASEAAARFSGLVRQSQTAENRYGLALALIRAGRPDDARPLVDSLLQEAPGNLSYRLLEAELQLGQDPAAATESLRRLLDLYPDHLAVGVLYARALQKQGLSEPQTRLLTGLLRRYPELPQLWLQLADAWGQLGDRLRYYLALSEYQLLRGNVDGAERNLRAALKLAESNRNEKARIRQRLEEAARIREDLKF